MKLLYVGLIVLASCGQNRNDKMSSLLNERKMIHDSMPAIKERRDSLIDVMTSNKKDSLKAMDLAVIATKKYDSLEQRLPQVNFSIDSLEKMH